jgi:hypothetical protein
MTGIPKAIGPPIAHTQTPCFRTNTTVDFYCTQCVHLHLTSLGSAVALQTHRDLGSK